MAYAGFDTYACPDLALMQRLKTETNFTFVGYYLEAPSQPAATWVGKRAALVAMGWGLAPIYVGQQVEGPGSHLVTAARGVLDAADACGKLYAEGFPDGSWVYLDLENGPPFSAAQQAYVGSWIDAVESEGYRAGVYCSFLFAAEVHALRPSARIWTFHVPTTKEYPVSGTHFPEYDPTNSGYPGAMMWQFGDEAMLTAFGLIVDLDSSTFADPSAPAPPPVVTRAAPAAAIAKSATITVRIEVIISA